MHEFYVQFHSLQDVQDFTALAYSQEHRMKVGGETFQVNATSFMGILALNCRKPQRVTVTCPEEDLQQIKQDFSRFLAP